MWSEKLTVDKEILAGKPIIKGTRISVDFVIDLLANGWSNVEIVKNYPQITSNDIQACLEYASSLIKEENVILL